MRWLLALSLAACSTTDTYDPEKERSDLLRGLREAHGDANLVADGRHYMVSPEALQREIRTFTSELADAVEAGWGSGRDSSSVSGREPVIAEPWLERGLRVNDISVVACRADRATFYRVFIERPPETGYSIQVVRGTPAVDAAWEGLVAAARAQAVFTDTFGPMGELIRPGSRSIRGTGRPPDPPPSGSP